MNIIYTNNYEKSPGLVASAFIGSFNPIAIGCHRMVGHQPGRCPHRPQAKSAISWFGFYI